MKRSNLENLIKNHNTFQMLNTNPPGFHCSSLTWESYVRDCSVSHQQMLDTLFRQHFFNKTVLWSGTVVQMNPNYVTINPTPSSLSFAPPLIRLNILPTFSYQYNFRQGRELPFKGILKQYGSYPLGSFHCYLMINIITFYQPLYLILQYLIYFQQIIMHHA